MKKPDNKTFVVREALLPIGDGSHLQRWYIYRDFLPVDTINRYIHRKSGVSPKTGRTYAYHLTAWLNFLHLRGKEYFQADRLDVDTYKDYLAYQMHCHNQVLKLTADITYSTLYGALVAIQEFYRWLDNYDEVLTPAPKHKKSGIQKRTKHSFLYGQIYEIDVDDIIEIENMRLKQSGYKKHWLTETEKKRILDAFRTIRDKAMFMLLCEGMRIDEVLSIKYSSYDSGELTVKPSRSKGHSDEHEDKFRTIAFHDQRTGQFIDQYKETERCDVETELDEYLEPLFVNLKQHQYSYGKAVCYRNWWGILKTAVEKAGIDPSEIATHVGRRSFIQEKLEEGEDPEIIRQMVGWASLSPLDSYKDARSKVVMKNAAESRRRNWTKGDKDSSGKVR